MKGVYITGIFESFERYILKDEYFSFFFYYYFS